LWSQAFTNIIWATYYGTTTDNFAISPDGTQNASKVLMGAGDTATLRQSISGPTNGQPYTFSLYIKQGSGVTAFLDISDTTSTVNITPTSEWVRYTYTANWNTTNNYIDIELRGTSGVAYCYIWGAQLEAGSYSTSLINTTSASATRVADACFKTGISSLIGQSEGVFYAEFTVPETQSPSFFSISNGSSANRIIFGYYLGALRYYTDSSTGAFASGGIIDSSPVVGQVYKIALAYKNNDFVVYKNGTNTNTLTTFTVPSSLTEMDNQAGGAGQYIYASVKEILLFKTRLTNAELASLTTI
jgi:hypothetical protein